MFIYMFLLCWQLQSSSQQKQEQDRRETDQSHSKIVQQLETRLYDVENINKVKIFCLYV